MKTSLTARGKNNQKECCYGHIECCERQKRGLSLNYSLILLGRGFIFFAAKALGLKEFRLPEMNHFLVASEHEGWVNDLHSGDQLI
ncbi:hypothetical protein HI914_02050 [Erysiphe necator]|nr:hypothetical protein HI914_02050 [Erysiphe necator]